jgi:DNA polymerase III delta subunit
MIIFLYGEDSYRRGRKLKELVKAYREKHASVDMTTFDLEDDPDNWQRARDFLGQPSMFVDTKLIVIKEAQTVDGKEWIKLLKEQTDAKKIFVIISDRKPAKAKFKFLLKEPIKSQEFSDLEGAALSAFIKKEAALREMRLAGSALKFFLTGISEGRDRSIRAVNELEKLYLQGFRDEVSQAELRESIRFEKKEAVWKAASAILRSRDLPSRLGALENMFLQREAPSYVFNSLGFQAKGKAALRLADYDVSIKSGGLEYEEALTDFVIDN